MLVSCHEYLNSAWQFVRFWVPHAVSRVTSLCAACCEIHGQMGALCWSVGSNPAFSPSPFSLSAWAEVMTFCRIFGSRKGTRNHSAPKGGTSHLVNELGATSLPRSRSSHLVLYQTISAKQVTTSYKAFKSTQLSDTLLFK